MADYSFIANGQLVADAIKFYPRDAAGRFVSGGTIELSGCSGASLSNARETTDSQGQQCLVASLKASAAAGTCQLTAVYGNKRCNCDITFTRQKLQPCSALQGFDIGDPVTELFRAVFQLKDTHGKPYLGQDVIVTLSENAELVSYTIDDNGNLVIDAIATGSGDVYATLKQQDMPNGECRVKIATIARANAISCDTVECEVVGGALVVGQPGKFVVKVVDLAGAPVSTGVTFKLDGATIEKSSYSSTLEGWLLDIIPTAENVVGSLLSSSLGNCADFCEVSAITRALDCDTVSCDVLSGAFVRGEPTTMVIMAKDTTGAPITDSVEIEWQGAEDIGDPTYSASLGAWLVRMTPTAQTVVGSLITTPLGTCTNFCSRDTVTMQSCCPRIRSIDLPTMIVGEQYTGTFLAETGADVAVSGLPDGISYDRASGALSGTVTTEGTSNVVFRYGGCMLPVTILRMQPQVSESDCCPKMTNISLPTGIVGDDYVGFAVFSGVGERTYEASSLPPGIELNESTGQFTGTPTQRGNYVTLLRVSDSRGTCTYNLTFDIDNPPADCPAAGPKIKTIPRLSSVVGEPVNVQFIASPGAEFVAAIKGGLMLGSDGSLTGTPTEPGVIALTIIARDQSGEECSINVHYNVVEERSQTVMIDDSVTSLSFCVCRGRKTIANIGASGQLEVEGDMPPGMMLNGGAIIGTPTECGNFKFTLKPGKGAPVEVMIIVEDCGVESAPPPSPIKDMMMKPLPPTPEPPCWVRLIRCVTINGIDYQASYEQPSNPLRVTQEESTHLLNNGYAIAVTDGGTNVQ